MSPGPDNWYNRISDRWERRARNAEAKIAELQARVAELEAANEWFDPQLIPPPEQRVIRAIVFAHRKDNGNWSIKVPILKWQPATGLFVPPPPFDSPQSNAD